MEGKIMILPSMILPNPLRFLHDLPTRVGEREDRLGAELRAARAVAGTVGDSFALVEQNFLSPG